MAKQGVSAPLSCCMWAEGYQCHPPHTKSPANNAAGHGNAHVEVVFAGKKAQATSRKGRAMQQAGKVASVSEK